MNVKKSESLILFVLGFGIFLFTRLSVLFPTIPVTILIAPVFILRFIRTQKAGRGIMLTLFGFILAMNISMFGLFDIGVGISSITFNLIRISILALLYFFPFMTDRLTYPKFKDPGSLSSLRYPIVTTALFFLLTIEGPFEGSVQMGKFLFGPIVLKQYVSLLGLSGVVFMTNWFVSAANWCWENNFYWQKTRRLTVVYGLIVLSILTYETVKPYSSPNSNAVKTASIILIPEDGRNQVDILTSPPYEWPTNPTIIASYMPGIEFGFSIVSVTYNGHILAIIHFDRDSTP